MKCVHPRGAFSRVIFKLLFVSLFATVIAQPQVKKASAFTTIDYPGADRTEAHGINPQGDIVGVYHENGFHGYLLTKGEFKTIDYPGASYTAAHGVNAQGDIVGEYMIGDRVHGFLLSNGIFTHLDVDFPDTPASSYPARPLGINDDGDIVGYYFGPTIRGFLLRDGVFTRIDFPGAIETEPYGINSQGEIVGIYYNAGPDIARAFILKNGTFSAIDVPGANPSSGNVGLAFGINPRGDIVGVFGATPNGDRAYLLSKSLFMGIDAPREFGLEPHGISPRGMIVGFYATAGNVLHGFVTSR